MENAKKFFEEVIKTEEAKTILAATEAPENEEARIAAYINIAKKLGIELTEDEINAYLTTNSEADSAELDDEELSQLAGGGASVDCKSSYKNEENCLIFDGCDKFFREYDNYICRSENAGALKYSGPEYEAIYQKYFARCGNLDVFKEYRVAMGRSPSL